MCASAKFWMSVLTDIRNRGVRDVFFLVCDGLKGLPEVVGNVWPLTIVQTCIIHYPDTVVMPIPVVPVLAGGGETARQYRHNHRASRKARSWSGGL
jgi:hypothetical protein